MPVRLSGPGCGCWRRTKAALRAITLQLPAENLIGEPRAVIDPDAIRKARTELKAAIREGIDSGVAEGFDPAEHLRTLKAKRANG